MCFKKGFFSFFFILFCFSNLISQRVLKGKIQNQITGENLPFVPVVYGESGEGVLTDIDGKFFISSQGLHFPCELKISYIGFKSKSYLVSKESDQEILIQLFPQELSLQEVVIRPGENPAHSIIKKVIEQKEFNRPENLPAFSYTSYNKLYVTTDLQENVDTVSKMDTSGKNEIGKFLNKQHLFMSESISKKHYQYKNKNHEEILASRVSGFKSSPFTLLATQLQSFSFYPDQIELLQIKYINPVAEGTFKRYNFTLEDTLFQGKDSLFVISFSPKSNAKFQGLKGLFYISSNGYAIQSVIAEPSGESKTITLAIRQNYEKINNEKWFPVQLNTDWIYNTVQLDDKSKDSKNSPKLKVISRSYIKNIQFNPENEKIKFNEIELRMNKDADQKEESFWNKFRTDSLNFKEKETYRFNDSIGKKEKFDAKLKSYEALMSGEFPIGYVNLQLKHLFRFNYFEGYRFGLGLATGNKISEKIKLAGYIAYGTWDKSLKYGGEFTGFLSKKKDAQLHFLYSKDVVESGGSDFLEDNPSLINTDLYRRLLLWKFDQREMVQGSISFRGFRYFKFHLFANQQKRESSTGYLPLTNPESITQRNFNQNELGLQVRFVFKEKFIQTPKRLISLGSKFPKIYFIFRKGFALDFPNDVPSLSYARMETKVEYSKEFLSFGKLNILFHASSAQGELPYTLLFAGRGSSPYSNFGLSCPNTFETMGTNEFINSSQMSLFINHNFGNLLPVKSKWNPQLEICHHMGIGHLKNAQSIENFGIQTMEKGFFESGIRIHRLIGSSASGLGIGFFYRYGEYAKTDPKLNLAIKLALSSTL